MAEGEAAGGNDFGEIDLTWTDKLRKMVSSDAEWEAIILKKMEEKRNKGNGQIPPPSKDESDGAAENEAALAEVIATPLCKFHDLHPEMGIESQEPPSSPFSVGGLFTKIRSYIPTRKGGTDGGQGQAHDAMAEVDGTRDQLMESQ